MKSQFQKPKNGTVFKSETGKLYQFTPGSIAVLLAWPKPLAWKKTRRNPGWFHFRPSISIPDYWGDRSKENKEKAAGSSFGKCTELARTGYVEQAWQQWFETIPEQIRAAVVLFPKRQWHMLSFLARCGNAARDLTATNPALAFALASNWVFHAPAVQRPMRSARTLASKKQRHILAWLGFPGSESARKILAKLRHAALTIPGLLYLRQAMSDPRACKLMAHVPWINPGVLRMVTDPQLLPYVTPVLLEEVASNPMENCYPNAAYLLRDILYMLQEVLPIAVLARPMRSLEALRKTHEDLVGDLNTRNYPRVNIAFPEPPLPGDDTIIPITTARELAEEGRMQHNCVASYARRVQGNQCYIYRVLSPERCTLALTRRGNTWMFSEVKRVWNQEPSAATMRVIAGWFNANAPCRG